MAHQKLGMDTDLQTLPIPLLQFHPQAKSLGHHLVQMVPARLCLLTSGHSMPSHEEEAKTCWRKSQPAKPRHCQLLSGSLTGSPAGQPRLSSPGDEETRDTVLHQSVVGEQFEQWKKICSGNKCGTGVAGGEKSDWQCVPCVPCLGAVWCRWWWWGR